MKIVQAEVSAPAALYKDSCPKHSTSRFCEAHKEKHNGKRSCGWVKTCLREGKAEKRKGPRRRPGQEVKRETKPAN